MKSFLSNSVKILIVLIAFSLGFYFMLLDPAKKLYLYYKSRDFKIASAEIVDSYIEKSIFGSSRKHGGYSSSRYYFRVKYKFRVGSKEYYGSNPGTIPKLLSNVEALELVRKYKKGVKTIVYYNPKNPNENFLIRKIYNYQIINIVVFLFTFVIIISFFYYYYW